MSLSLRSRTWRARRPLDFFALEYRLDHLLRPTPSRTSPSWMELQWVVVLVSVYMPVQDRNRAHRVCHAWNDHWFLPGCWWLFLPITPRWRNGKWNLSWAYVGAFDRRADLLCWDGYHTYIPAFSATWRHGCQSSYSRTTPRSATFGNCQQDHGRVLHGTTVCERGANPPSWDAAEVRRQVLQAQHDRGHPRGSQTGDREQRVGREDIEDIILTLSNRTQGHPPPGKEMDDLRSVPARASYCCSLYETSGFHRGSQSPTLEQASDAANLATGHAWSRDQ